MRKITLVGTAVAASTAASLLLSPTALATTGEEHEVGMHQPLPTTVDTVDAPQQSHEQCPGVSEDMDGWHFVLPGQSEFIELRVTFEPGGEQVITTFGPPSDKHAYVASTPGAVLVEASATVEGESEDFRLSHTCPATDEDTPGEETPEEETPGEDTPDEELPAGGGEEEPGGVSPDGESGDEMPEDETLPAGGGEEEATGDLAETGSSTPVVPLGVGAALLVAAGGYLALRRRNATQD